LSEIRISGNERLHKDYLRQRIKNKVPGIFNQYQLQEAFQHLLSDPLFERINGNIYPGENPGEAILDLEVHRAQPYHLSLLVDNHNTPAIGEDQVALSGQIRNLTGFGDVLNLQFEMSEGLDDYSVSYAYPLNSLDTSLLFAFEDSRSSVIEKALKHADIESEYQTLSLGINHPLIRTPERQLNLGVLLSWRESQTWFLGEGTPFSAGVEADGSSSTTVVRLTQDYSQRSSEEVLAVRSTFNFGISALDSTTNPDGLPDSRFFSWIGQFQYAVRMPVEGSQLIVNGNLQLSADPLLPLEQIAIGGPDSIRGYRTNQLIRDNGWDSSIEYRHPVMGNPFNKKRSSLQLALFFDAGSAWNRGDSKWDDQISSAGIGMIWQYKHYHAQVYWAEPFQSLDRPDNNYLQDEGISFRLSTYY